MPLKYPDSDLVWLYLYFMTCFITLINHWWFVSNEPSLFGQTMVRSHLAFNIIGSVSFAAFGSPFLWYAYQYRQQISVRAHRDYGSICSSVIFLLHDFPLWIIELWMVWRWGWISVIQGVSIVVLTISFWLGFFGTWLGYVWFVAKLLQKYFGATAFNFRTQANPGGGGFGAGGPGVRGEQSSMIGGDDDYDGDYDGDDREMDYIGGGDGDDVGGAGAYRTPGRAVGPAAAGGGPDRSNSSNSSRRIRYGGGRRRNDYDDGGEYEEDEEEDDEYEEDEEDDDYDSREEEEEYEEDGGQYDSRYGGDGGGGYDRPPATRQQYQRNNNNNNFSGGGGRGGRRDGGGYNDEYDQNTPNLSRRRVAVPSSSSRVAAGASPAGALRY